MDHQVSTSAMKKIFFALIASAVALVAPAQRNVKVQSVHLKDGKVVTFDPDAVDSSRVVFTPEGDSLGVKVYVGGTSNDYLYSQIDFVTFYPQQSTGVNVNRNTAADLTRNPECWRLEFPRLYQGTDVTFEVTHSTQQYGITYSLEWDGNKRANRWTCYEFSDATPDNGVKRTNAWSTDSSIPAQYQTDGSDYSGSGFSRGHLCPSGDRTSSKEQNQQTFYYSNMQPQYQNHNGNQWNNLEAQVRSWGEDRSFCDTLYVVKAATIDDAQVIKYLRSDNTVPVPKYFYMCLLAVKGGAYKAIGFWTEHVNAVEKHPYSYYAKSIDEIERLTGIDFFCNLPDDIEQEVEASYNISEW